MWTEHNISIWVKKIIKEIEISFVFKSNTFLSTNKLGRRRICIKVCWEENIKKKKKYRRRCMKEKNEKSILGVPMIFKWIN